MKNERQKPSTSCSILMTIALIGVGAYLVYKFTQYFTMAGFIKTVKDFLLAIGFCIGVAVLLFTFMIIAASVSPILPPPRLRRRGKAFPVRCYPTELEPAAPGSEPPYKLESADQRTVFPVYLLASITNYGLSLAEITSRYSWSFIPQENVSRYAVVSENRPGSIIYPIEALDLYYTVFHKQGDLSIEQKPVNQPGFTGEIKIHPNMDRVKILFFASTMREAGNLSQSIHRTKPLKLELVVLDETGQDDPSATQKLYNRLYHFIRVYRENNDDSWMYQSRPTPFLWY